MRPSTRVCAPSSCADSLTRLGAETKIESPEELGALLADETRKWGAVIKSSGATID